jgi:predicted RNA-binding protein YlqC (UPF0109 family)
MQITDFEMMADLELTVDLKSGRMICRSGRIILNSGRMICRSGRIIIRPYAIIYTIFYQ